MRYQASDSRQLEKLSSQVEQSVGSLKLMEVQLSERKHGVELTREAQLDARERLLKELANNATSMQNASQVSHTDLFANGPSNACTHLNPPLPPGGSSIL